MPPRSTRRTSTTRSTQGTLAFGTQNRITKPTAASQAKKATKETSVSASTKPPLNAHVTTATPSPVPEDQTDDAAQPAQAIELSPGKSLAIRKQPPVSKTKVPPISKRNGKEGQAHKVSEAQIKRYWKGKEEERIAPRVHQQGLSVSEKVLREFDLSSQFGPCIGIPRVKRWKRADNLGLKPPLEVLAVLMKEEGAGNTKADRAFMDSLLTSRVTEGQ